MPEQNERPEREAPFPVTSFKEAAPHLRRPFAPNAVKYKVQTGKGTDRGGIVVGYLDARLVVERLNLVCPHLWTTIYEKWQDTADTKLLICHLTVDGLTRSDIGQGQGNTPQKAAYSDALKRAAVHFGIGVSLYAMRAPWIAVTDDGTLDSHDNPTLRRKERSRGEDTFEITPALDAWLRAGYQKWLKSDKNTFGDALDHGDEEGSPGALLEGSEPLADEEPVQVDLEFAAKREEIEKSYAELNGTARRSLPRGKFKAELDACDTVADLEKVATKVGGLNG